VLNQNLPSFWQQVGLQCSSRVHCGNKPYLSLAQDTESGSRREFKIVDGRKLQLLHLLAKKTSERETLGDSRRQVHSRLLPLAPTCSGPSSPPAVSATVSRVLQLRLLTSLHPRLIAIRLQDIPLSTAPKAQPLLGRTWRHAPTTCTFSTYGLAPSLPTTLHPRHSFIHSYRLPGNPTLLLRQPSDCAWSSRTFLAQAIIATNEADARHHVVG
jgi:hypothetical protein